MRILHLIDYPARPGGASRAPRGGGDEAVIAAAAVRDVTPEHSHEFCIIGASASLWRARACGVEPDVHLHAPLQRTVLATRALHAHLSRAGEPDVLQCWSRTSAALAWGLIRSGLVRGVMTPLDAPGGTGMLLAAARGRGIRLAAVAPPASDDGAEATLGLAPRTGSMDQRGALRESAGIAADTPVVVLLGGCGLHADAYRFVFLVSIGTACEADAVAVVPGLGAHRARGARLRRMFNRPRRLLVSDRPLPDLLAAADVAVCQGPFTGAAAVAIASAHRAGVPVVAPATVTPLALYSKEAAAACLAEHDSMGELARRLVALVDDLPRLRRIGAGLRAMEAGESPLAAGLRAMWAGTQSGTLAVSA